MSLEKTKVGDYVSISGRFGSPPTIYKIDRETKTQLISGSTRFRKDGRVIGSSGYYTKYGHPATEKDFKINEIQKAKQFIRSYAEKVDDEKAILIADYIKSLNLDE